MSLKLENSVVEFLKSNPEEKFTARKIANWICLNFPNECEEKKANSKSIETDDDLKQQIVAEIGSRRPRLQKKHEQIKTTDERPRRFYWTVKSDEAEIQESVEVGKKAGPVFGARAWKESDLYLPLSEYILTELRVYSKRIDEKKSTNKQGRKGNKWLYPDVVGMEDLTEDMEAKIRNVIEVSSDKQKKLWSFEVKMLLNRSNVREAYFQAVSNSSWANLGYLVAAEIREDTMKELRMLCSLHGIGLIQIERENPSESRIEIPAREKADVDWATCNRIAKENQDFSAFVELVRQFHLTGDPRPKEWDFCEDADSD
ncbi:MAG: HrgA protein [Gemmatimonadetes bacterium]|nr:HrgA protein [Gemmatimonadota bacterium]